jgi:plastocyanin
MRTLVLIALAALGLAGRALAGDLTVVVHTPEGQPVPDAVASFVPAGGLDPGAPIKFAWPMVMAQQNLQFSPFVLIAPVGSDVTFPNYDTVRHHVYSFSPAKRFELKLYGREQARSVKFDKVGTVALGCNIHDQMVGFIRVVDTPFAVKTDAAGRAVLKALPAGGGTLTVWHPYSRAPQGEVTRKLSDTGAAAQAVVVVDLRATGVQRR